MLARADEPATLLIAPTGGGKTLAGFLPTLAELADGTPPGPAHALHLAAQGAGRRHPPQPAHPGREMRACRSGSRTAPATPAYTQRRRQRVDPPHILLTTPESLALLLSYEDAPRIFARPLPRHRRRDPRPRRKQARRPADALPRRACRSLAPGLRRVGLSATVEDPPALARFLARHPTPARSCSPIRGRSPTSPCWRPKRRRPGPGGGGRYAIPRGAGRGEAPPHHA